MTKDDDYLVSAELAKEKLIHEIDILGNVYAVAKVIIMELIRNTDLTDCQRNEPMKLYAMCAYHQGMPFPFQATYSPPAVRVCPICEKAKNDE